MDNSVTSDVTTTAATDERPGAPVPSPRAARVQRADAVRNRVKILRAAEEVFAVEGLAVPIDDVARRRGWHWHRVPSLPHQGGAVRGDRGCASRNLIERAQGCALPLTLVRRCSLSCLT